jgi:cytochrome c
VELRLDAPDGPLVGTADLVTTGGANVAGEVTTAIDAPDDDPHRLYLVYAQRPGGPTNNLFELDELTFVGRGWRATPRRRPRSRPTGRPARSR